MRIVNRDELHLTLHYLGEITQEQDDPVRTNWRRCRRISSRLPFKGVAAFPLDGEPRGLWAGVQINPLLSTLHASIGAALTNVIGFRPEERTYSPHVTLARLNSQVSPQVQKQFFQTGRNLSIESIDIIRFALYSSIGVGTEPKCRKEEVFSLLP